MACKPRKPCLLQEVQRSQVIETEFAFLWIYCLSLFFENSYASNIFFQNSLLVGSSKFSFNALMNRRKEGDFKRLRG
jgi:hypothetical protein